jgi:hypothetical protein
VTTGPVVRDATPADLDAMVELFHRQRRRYAAFAPVFWRVAADDRDRHRPFLDLLVQAPEVVSLVADGGAAIAVDRGPGGWLVDDFAVADDDAWPTTGVTLLDAVRRRVAGPLTVVCAQRHEAKGAVLRAAGLTVHEAWWVGVPPGGAGAGPACPETPGTVADLVPAPPVYDPGGPALLVRHLPPVAGAPAGVLGRAGAEGAAVVVVPVAAGDHERIDLLAGHGFTVASVWYRTPTPP